MGAFASVDDAPGGSSLGALSKRRPLRGDRRGEPAHQRGLDKRRSCGEEESRGGRTGSRRNEFPVSFLGRVIRRTTLQTFTKDEQSKRNSSIFSSKNTNLIGPLSQVTGTSKNTTVLILHQRLCSAYTTTIILSWYVLLIRTCRSALFQERKKKNEQHV